MDQTPVTWQLSLLGKEITMFNQRNRGWAHPYPYAGGETLSTSGCGIFALGHCAQWLTGQPFDPGVWADFSCAHGGRGDDGTDRPVLLRALMETGMAGALGFRCDGRENRNDLPLLHQMLLGEAGVALCNLRVGHIVALVAARHGRDGLELLALDSACDSFHEKVRDHIREVIPGSLVRNPYLNREGMTTGYSENYAAFWVDASLPRDFNLLYRI